MREGEPSATARMVSFGRGIGMGATAPDPYADRLLPRGAARVVAASRGALRPLVRDASRLLSLGLVDHVTCRTLAIDRAVERAIRGGASQCVILGAGLDTRAHRLAALAGATVFEVDHPAMQAEKRRRVERAGIPSRGVVYVPVDFQRDALEEVLAASAHDRRATSVWIWEGVTMYLTRDATSATLAAVARASADGSTLALTYLEPTSPALVAGAGAFTRAFFGALGEPLRGTHTRGDMRALLATHGFDLRDDTSSREWARDEGLPHRLASPFRGERLALAIRRR